MSLIEDAAHHVRLDGATGVCAVDDEWWPCITRRLADALEEAWDQLRIIDDR